MVVTKVSLQYAVAMAAPAVVILENYGCSYLNQLAGRASAGAIFYPSVYPDTRILERFSGIDGHYYAIIT